jgi:hypothetical protein
VPFKQRMAEAHQALKTRELMLHLDSEPPRRAYFLFGGQYFANQENVIVFHADHRWRGDPFVYIQKQQPACKSPKGTVNHPAVTVGRHNLNLHWISCGFVAIRVAATLNGPLADVSTDTLAWYLRHNRTASIRSSIQLTGNE